MQRHVVKQHFNQLAPRHKEVLEWRGEAWITDSASLIAMLSLNLMLTIINLNHKPDTQEIYLVQSHCQVSK